MAIIRIITTAIALGALSSAIAAPVSQINRYTTVSHKAMPEQINPLLSVQTFHFPQNISTVGEAMKYWLQHSGYRLSDMEKQPDDFQIVSIKPLPRVQRTLGPLSIIDGLEVLAGKPVFSITQDRVAREINVHAIKNLEKAHG